MNIEEEIARQNREIEKKLAEMTESINAQMKRMMEATDPLKFLRAKKEEPEDNEPEEIVKGQIEWDDIEDWNCTFVYEYERKGKAVSMRVDLINTDELFLALNDVPLSEEQEPKDYKKIDIELKDTLLKGCVDIDDVGVVIAKMIIKDNDEVVLMSIYNRNCYDEEYGVYSAQVELDKDLNYLIPKDEECDCTLTLTADMGRPVMWAIFVEICNPDKVKQFIKDEDTYELFEIVRHYDYEDCYLFNIWGDEDEERINYKLEDSKGLEIDSGDICIRENNVFDYGKENNYIVDKNIHPKYVMVFTDLLIDFSATFKVPSWFNMQSCHFADATPSNVVFPMAFGDTISSISSTICCNGKRYHAVETNEHGREKFMNCYLYEYNKKRELYNEIASLC